jgi:hypothetical protein
MGVVGEASFRCRLAAPPARPIIAYSNRHRSGGMMYRWAVEPADREERRA